MTLFSLKDKVAIVTGGGKGIGESISKVFAKQGAVVHLLDLDQENGQRVASEIQASGGQAFFHHADVTQHEDLGKLFEKIYQQSGQLNILVNNAGIAHIGNVENTTEADMDRLYAVNIKSVYSCLYFGLQYMKKSGGGAIVNLASIASVVGLADRFAYSMTKGAVYSMTFSVAKDYLKDNIRCNAVGPARVHTPFVDGYLKNTYPGREEEMFEKLSKTQPIGRMGQPDEIAYLITYLCSDEAGFVTGSFYPIDGGFITLNT
ncbi:MAG: SDR family oxidoreductase [Microscillaceae bacterium]|nr:SDR family oxidoreductase [Microscillaceae bacterium]